MMMNLAWPLLPMNFRLITVITSPLVYGFLIGHRKLNYSSELIAELLYKINAYQHEFWLTPDYQFILIPVIIQTGGR